MKLNHFIKAENNAINAKANEDVTNATASSTFRDETPKRILSRAPSDGVSGTALGMPPKEYKEPYEPNDELYMKPYEGPFAETCLSERIVSMPVEHASMNTGIDNGEHDGGKDKTVKAPEIVLISKSRYRFGWGFWRRKHTPPQRRKGVFEKLRNILGLLLCSSKQREREVSGMKKKKRESQREQKRRQKFGKEGDDQPLLSKHQERSDRVIFAVAQEKKETDVLCDYASEGAVDGLNDDDKVYHSPPPVKKHSPSPPPSPVKDATTILDVSEIERILGLSSPPPFSPQRSPPRSRVGEDRVVSPNPSSSSSSSPPVSSPPSENESFPSTFDVSLEPQLSTCEEDEKVRCADVSASTHRHHDDERRNDRENFKAAFWRAVASSREKPKVRLSSSREHPWDDPDLEKPPTPRRRNACVHKNFQRKTTTSTNPVGQGLITFQQENEELGLTLVVGSDDVYLEDVIERLQEIRPLQFSDAEREDIQLGNKCVMFSVPRLSMRMNWGEFAKLSTVNLLNLVVERPLLVRIELEDKSSCGEGLDLS